ncbi:MAG: hypothetical protein C5B50_22250 [Verrucomicrobia bacterium]|nr:MAG: hypothetical protein C5B50_22250 [Verrucomicrobiota bacterium]
MINAYTSWEGTPISQQEVLDLARCFIRSIRQLPYPVADEPITQIRSNGTAPPQVALDGGPIGRTYWEFHFEYTVSGKLVDPSCARVFVDAITGKTSLAHMKGKT